MRKWNFWQISIHLFFVKIVLSNVHICKFSEMLIIYCSFLMQGMSLVQRRNPWGRKAEMLVNKCCLSSFKVSKFSQPLLYFKRVWGGRGGCAFFCFFIMLRGGWGGSASWHRFFTIFNLNFRRQVFLGFSSSIRWWFFANFNMWSVHVFNENCPRLSVVAHITCRGYKRDRKGSRSLFSAVTWLIFFYSLSLSPSLSLSLLITLFFILKNEHADTIFFCTVEIAMYIAIFKEYALVSFKERERERGVKF